MGVAASLAVLPGVTQADWQPVTVAKFEFVEGRVGCTGPGELAYRVPFEARQIKALYGLPMRLRTCTVKQRKPGRTIEVEVDCPDSEEQGEFFPTLPASADVSGFVEGCLGLESHAFTGAGWSISTSGEIGLRASGTLDSAGVSVAYSGAASGSSEETGPFGTPPVVTIVLRVVPETAAGEPAPNLELATYLVLAPSPVTYRACLSELCPVVAESARWLVPDELSDLVRLIEDGAP